MCQDIKNRERETPLETFRHTHVQKAPFLECFDNSHSKYPCWTTQAFWWFPGTLYSGSPTPGRMNTKVASGLRDGNPPVRISVQWTKKTKPVKVKSQKLLTAGNARQGVLYVITVNRTPSQLRNYL
ncbi:hypothetical protein TGME49_267435 [Toxoplasma gondii ME49]|uniref:Uncharacterized protein n=3 Tax=Toxoplasma gondii TaxID=5811 RepID=A0A2G8Y539_TOXGO|nr:hypothetical protein TGME49_267435 [Toxoplasma gondii ME49]EPT27579.1 hypothetical protein TGME49_267435 [Toxoplasma gondii ME49]KYF45590.1 hypothetical protein TGARI_267435 [Toxoplasma gondii ARI]PIM02129.1 hypothetical protein TGCOUG_267435 [Toxoplasma gondii COUG]|eukprot:XP_018636236.1 hypothetical protein TGME49_267435 [Toxoplasma gondii ME49]